MLDIDVLIVLLEIKERRRTAPSDSISIAKFYILINKIKKLYLRLLSTILLLQKI